MRLFISFAQPDIARVRELADLLYRAGFTPWFSQKLEVGLPWLDQILEEIRQSDVFLYTLSASSLSSEWCQREYREAVEKGKPILSILIDSATVVPAELAERQYAEFTQGADSDSALRIVGSIVKLAFRHTKVPKTPATPKGIPARALEELSQLPIDAQASNPLSLPEDGRDLDDLLAEAYREKETNPEKALLLFYQLQKIKPDFMGPRTRDLIAQQEASLKSIRLTNMRSQAEELMAAGAWEEAEKVAVKMVDLEPTKRPFLKSLLQAWGEALVKSAEWEAAEAVGRKRSTLGGKDGQTLLLDVWNARIAAALEKRSWQEAAATARKARELGRTRGPRLREILVSWGDALKREGDWPAVEQVGRELLGYNSRDSEGRRLVETAVTNAEYKALYDRAVTFRRKGRDEAIQLLADLQKACPSYGDPRGLLSGRPIAPDFASWLQLHKTLRFAQPLRSFTFDPAGGSSRLYVVEDAGLRVLEMPDADEIGMYALTEQRKKPILTVISDSADYLFSSSDSGTVAWDVPTGEVTLRLPRAAHLSYAPETGLLATADQKSIELWDLRAEGSRVATLKGHKDSVSALALANDGSLLASSALTNTVWIWRAREAERREILAVRSVPWFSLLKFSPSGKFLAGAASGHLAIWRKRGDSFSEKPALLPVQELQSIAFSADDSLVAAGATSGRITLWDVRKAQCLLEIPAHSAAVSHLLFSPDRTLLASGCSDGTLKIWGMGHSEGPNLRED